MKIIINGFALALVCGALATAASAQPGSSSNVSQSTANSNNNSPSNSSDTYSTPHTANASDASNVNNPANQNNAANGAASTTAPATTTDTTRSATTTDTSSSADTSAASDMNTPAGTLSHHDKAFIMKVAHASTNEVALAQLAADHSASADVKAFAQQMITDHGQANNELMALASQKGVDISKAVEKGQKEDVDSLSAKNGADFDKAYMKNQLHAHEETVKLFKKESEDGKDADVVAFANKYLPILTGHCEKAKSIKMSVDQGS